MSDLTEAEELVALDARLAADRAREAAALRLRFRLPGRPWYVAAGNGPPCFAVYRKAWNAPFPFAEAVALLGQFTLARREHRRSGCLAIAPPGMPPDSATERAGEVIGESVLALTASGGRGHGPDWILEGHANMPEVGWVRFQIECVAPFLLRVREPASYDQRGDPVGQVEHECPPLPGAVVQRWASGAPDAYRYSWFWNTVEAFRTWAATVPAEGATR